MSGKPPSVVFREFRALRTSRPPRQCRVTGHVGPELGEPPSSSIPVLASSLDSFASAFTPLDDATTLMTTPVPAVSEGPAPFLLRLDSLMGSKRSASTLEESSQFCSQFTSAVPETLRARCSSLDEEEDVPAELPEENNIPAEPHSAKGNEYSSDEEHSSYAATIVQENDEEVEAQPEPVSKNWEHDHVVPIPSPRAARLLLDPALPSARLAPWSRNSIEILQNVRPDAGPQQPILSPRDARPMVAKRRPTAEVASSRMVSPLTSRLKWNDHGNTTRRSSLHHGTTPTYPELVAGNHLHIESSSSSVSSYDTLDTALRLVGHSTTRIVDNSRQASVPPSAYRMMQHSGGGSSPITTGRPESLIKEIPQSKMRAGTIAAVPPAVLNGTADQALSSRVSPRLDDEAYAAYLAGSTARRSTRGKRRRDIGMLTPCHSNSSRMMVNPEPLAGESNRQHTELMLVNRIQQQQQQQILLQRKRSEKKNTVQQSPAVLRSCCIGVPNGRKRNRVSGRGGATFATAALLHHNEEQAHEPTTNRQPPHHQLQLILQTKQPKETPSATPPPLSSMRPWDQPMNTAKPSSITLLTPPNIPCTPTAWTGRYKTNYASASTVRPSVLVEPRSRRTTRAPAALTERAEPPTPSNNSTSKPRNVFSRTLQMMRHIASPRN